MKRILVTGRNSFLGTSLIKYLRGDHRYTTDIIDLRDRKWKNRNLGEYDCIFYVAGIAHSDFIGSKKEEKKYYKVNTELAAEVAKKAKSDGVKQFIFMSTSIVYGGSTRLGTTSIITPKTKPSPQNYYGKSKHLAEKKIKRFEDENFHVCIIRSPMVYGKGCKGNYPKLRKLSIKLPFFPIVNNQRSMIYVENLMEYIRLLIENEEYGTFWPQNAEYVNTSELVKMIGRVHGKDVRLVSGFEGIIKLMGYFSKTSLRVFGNMSYAMDMSQYKEDYRLYNFQESIKKTEE